jgi:D-lactate dehydrogenase
LAQFPSLKHIAARSTGFDHIDLIEAKARGISTSYVPAYGENTVAEFAMGLTLTVSRKIYESVKRVEVEGLFSQDGLRGFDLKGKTIGILGTGRIGAHMIRIAKGFDMKVIAFDAFPKESLAQELGFAYMSLDDVLAQADVVSVHLPYMKETHHILNKSNIMKMKKGSVLINTARGALVETEAIIQALRKEVLAGVGLDVLEEEGYIDDEAKLLFGHPKKEVLKTTLENHYLIEHPRAIITPHNAFNTEEAMRRILDTTIDNIAAFGRGEAKNLVP